MTNTLNDLKNEEYCYLTTTGRVTGKPHEIEIWFGLRDDTFYLMSGGRDNSDWVKNLLKNSSVTLRVANRTLHATARLVQDEAEEAMARNLLADKYNERGSDGLLSSWARSAMVVGIEIRN